MKLPIASTFYCSAPYIDEFYARATAAAEAFDYQILLANDGSPDESLNLAVALTRDDPHVTIIDLSHHFAPSASSATVYSEPSSDPTQS